MTKKKTGGEITTPESWRVWGWCPMVILYWGSPDWVSWRLGVETHVIWREDYKSIGVDIRVGPFAVMADVDRKDENYE